MDGPGYLGANGDLRFALDGYYGVKQHACDRIKGLLIGGVDDEVYETV